LLHQLAKQGLELVEESGELRPEINRLGAGGDYVDSMRKAESCAPRSTDWGPEATTWEYVAGGVLEGGARGCV
jgi:hypothetical protein